MVRISDIIGKREQPQEPDREKPQKPTPQPSFSQFATDLSEKIGLMDKQRTQGLYQDMLSAADDLIQKIKQNKQKQIEILKIKQILVKLIDQISMGNDYLFSLSYLSDIDDYLPGHLLNSCIYSLGLGISLGIEKSKLEELGIACLFYTQDTADLLKDISGLPQVVSIVVSQHHERFDGSGYPQGLKADQIHEFSRIVGLCDTYEALTHSRPNQKKLLPNEAITKIIQEKSLFAPKILKKFIETMGIYPIESWVELNNGEIGKVIGINKTSVLRPVVEVILDPQGQRLSETRLIDLSQQTNLYIKKPLNENEFNVEINIEKGRS